MRRFRKEQRKGKVQINVSTSFFVPKPFTPFQWAPMYTEQDFVEKAKVVKNEVRAQLNQRSIRYNWHEPDVTSLEGFACKRDRRCSNVILRAYEKGAIYDAWSENFDYNIWKESIAETNTDIDILHTSRDEPQMRSSHGISLMQVSPKIPDVNGAGKERNRNTKLPSEMFRLRSYAIWRRCML